MKKKGFTLVELLGVIVILSIILIIAIPKILDIIENAERNAYKESVELMAHTAQIQYKTNEVKGSAEEIPEGGIVYEFENGEYKTENKLNFKGDRPYSGTITLTKNKKVIIQKLVSKNKKWCAIKDESEKGARVGKSTDKDFECIVEENKPIVDKKACELEIGKETINGEEKEVYYVDSVSDLYKLSQEVNGGNNYSGKIIRVRNNLDMSDKSNTCGEREFLPIGTLNKSFSGTFDGGAKVISNLEINKPSQDYVGLFGYVEGVDSSNKANIYGIRINNETIIGGWNVGGLIGRIDSNAIIKEIELDNINIRGSNYVGGIGFIQSTRSIDVNNILLKTGTITSEVSEGGLVNGREYDYYKNAIVENVTLNAGTIYTTLKSNNTYHSNNVVINGRNVTDGFDIKGIDDINFYEAAGLDTWIGGDNDSSGYYFDYDNNGKVILKGIKNNPIEFSLSKDGEGNYIIKSASDWKQASIKPSETYKVENNLDFSSNKYYMLGSKFNIFNGTIRGNDKTLSNITISANKADYIGLIGYVNSGTIYGLVLDNIKVNGYDYTGIIGYVKGVNNSNKANIYGIRINNEAVIGNWNVGGLIGHIDSSAIIKEIELDNINIRGSNYVGGIGFIQSTSSIDVNNILIKTGTITAEVSEGGLVNGNEYDYYKNAIVENVTLNAGTTYTTLKSNNTYHSNNVVINGRNVTDGFNPSLIGNLEYYAEIIETLYTGDSNSTGYFFDYVNGKDGIYLVKSYNLTFTSPSGDDPDDTNTEGGGTSSDTCYITIPCTGSGKYRKCYINYYENGISEAPYLNDVTLNLTRGSSCASYSPNNSPGGFYFYVSKKSSATGTCSVTFRTKSNKDCTTTTYKTISF